LATVRFPAEAPFQIVGNATALCGLGIDLLEVGAGRHGIVLRFAEQMLVAAVSGLPQQVLAVALLVETLVAQVAEEKKI
jgi:hypothetical protein